MLRKNRLEKVEREMERMGIGQLLVSDPWAILYLTGKKYEPGERFLGLFLSLGEDPVLFVNELFRSDEDLGVEPVYLKDGDPLEEILARYVYEDRALGVDRTLDAGFLLPMMENKLAKGFVVGSMAVDKARAVKDEDEIRWMRASSRINDQAMARFPGLLHTGVTEKEVASKMPEIYRELGASGYSFEPIVAFGDNAADPHHMPDGTELKEGDVVLFDVGCVYQGYCSDMTRTFFWMKEPTEEQKVIYELVRMANEEAEKMCAPGVEISRLDEKAREIIIKGGYGKDFTHRLGHFIGLQDHEYGDVSAKNHDPAVSGNVFSIEPGIYRRGAAGVRIEDLVLITPEGCEVLNQYPKKLQVWKEGQEGKE